MDIVKRLKAKPPKGFVTSLLMIDAATEIERLRQKHKDMVSKLKWVVNEYNKLLNDHNELLKETTGGE